MQPVAPSNTDRLPPFGGGADRLPPLGGGEVVETRSVDLARQRLARAYRPHRLAPGPDHDRFRFRHCGVRLDGASLNTLEYGAEVDIDPGDFETFYMVEFPLSGGVRGRFGRDDFASSSARCGQVLSPGRPILSNWASGTRQLMLRIDRDAVCRRLSDLAGVPARRPPVFRPTFDFDTSLGQRIVTLMRLLASEADLSDPIGDGGLVATPIINALLASLLLHQPHDQSGFMQSGNHVAAPSHVVRAAAFMDAHADRPLTIAGVARVVGVSERALQDGFRRFKGTSPHTFLQACRLDRARLLLSEQDASMSVAMIARSCGMPHAGRFAQAYRARFGETPSASRRRLSRSRMV